MITRRFLLRAAGASLALPLLESLAPRSAFAAPPPKRFLAWYIPNGIHMAAWTPATDGAGYALTPILMPLAPVKGSVLVLTGLANRPARPDGPGDHASGTGAFLTAAHPLKTEGANIKNGVSLDQVAAAALGAMTKFPSLQLGIDGGSSAGGCDSGYSCAYARNISWANETTPLPKLVNPQTVFDRMFDGPDPMQSAAEAARRRRYKKSVLDHALDEATRLRGRLGTTDRRKMDEYLTGVRELEKRVSDGAGPVCTPGGRPATTLDYPSHVRAMCDLMVLALQCDLTRIITFMMGNAGSNRTHPFLGVSGAHHEISHHQGDAAKHAMLQKIDTWEVEQLAYLLGRMKSVVEPGGGTLLERTIVFFSSEIEDGNSHAHVNMPVLVAGGAGVIKVGRHQRYPQERPIANLFVSFLQGLGVAATSFGQNSTGPLEGLG